MILHSGTPMPRRFSRFLLLCLCCLPLPAFAAVPKKAPPPPPGPETMEVKTLMLERGRLVIDNPMNQKSMDDDWRGFQPGKWQCEEGQGVKVTAVPGDHGPYRIRHFDLTDFVLQVSFMFDGVDELSFGFDNDGGQHMMGCHLSPDGISINRTPLIGKDRKDDAMDHATCKLERGVWHTLVWECKGQEMLACVDQKWVVYGNADGIDCYKTYTAFSTGSVPGKFIHVANYRAWQAAGFSPEWESKRRARVVEYKSKKH